ncbi:MAG: electron transfer flavoprotein subunit beta/FixA family protein [Phycisphaerae bacterium]|jgi:electron transfer flavoprotein beta subunit
MKILVTFKSVPENGAAEANTRVINPFDAIAVEEALRLRERGEAAEVAAVTIGEPAVEEQCRAALAMGADRCIRIDDARPLDPYAVARILKAVVDRESPGMVLMGKQAVDDDCGQTGQMLAGLLGWPQATFASRIALAAGRETAECTRETDAGLEVIEVRLPAVFTADLRLNEPRYVSLPGLVKARKKPIEVLTCAQLGVDARPRTALLAVAAPPQRAGGAVVASVDELVLKLREEAKVI